MHTVYRRRPRHQCLAHQTSASRRRRQSEWKRAYVIIHPALPFRSPLSRWSDRSSGSPKPSRRTYSRPACQLCARVSVSPSPAQCHHVVQASRRSPAYSPHAPRPLPDVELVDIQHVPRGQMTSPAPPDFGTRFSKCIARHREHHPRQLAHRGVLDGQGSPNTTTNSTGRFSAVVCNRPPRYHATRIAQGGVVARSRPFPLSLPRLSWTKRPRGERPTEILDNRHAYAPIGLTLAHARIRTTDTNYAWARAHASFSNYTHEMYFERGCGKMHPCHSETTQLRACAHSTWDRTIKYEQASCTCAT